MKHFSVHTRELQSADRAMPVRSQSSILPTHGMIMNDVMGRVRTLILHSMLSLSTTIYFIQIQFLFAANVTCIRYWPRTYQTDFPTFDGQTWKQST
jgi:hypothetical protein